MNVDILEQAAAEACVVAAASPWFLLAASHCVDSLGVSNTAPLPCDSSYPIHDSKQERSTGLAQ